MRTRPERAAIEQAWQDGRALTYDPQNVALMVYRGEALVMSRTDDEDEGIALLHKAVALAGNSADLHSIKQRGQTLLQRYGQGAPYTGASLL